MSSADIKIDRGRCISSGNCTAIAPDWFGFDDHDEVTANQPSPGQDLPQQVYDAAQQCPVDAIKVEGSA